MPRIPFPLGLTEKENLPKTRQSLRNCINSEGSIVSRRGIVGLNTHPNNARGSFEWNGSLYVVFGLELVKVTNLATGAYSLIGAIAGSEVIETAVGFNTAVIVVKGGALYTLDTADTLVDITGNANIVASVDVAHIDGRFVYIPSDGSPAYFSDVGAAGTVQPLSFFDAEELPDKNNGVFNLSNTLYITGTDSIELFRDTGGTPNPFTRIPGSRINNGFIGGLVEGTDTFFFIGREKDQDFGIYAIGQGRAPKISNTAVDILLSKYTIAEMAEAIPGRVKWAGNDMATWAFRDDSIGFVNGNWIVLDTVFDGVSRTWGAGFITQIDGSYYTAFETNLGKFSKVNTDYGERITRIIDFGIDHPDHEYFPIQSIELSISQGFNDFTGPPLDSGSVALFMSRDNVTYGQPLYRNLGNLGQYSNRLVWNYAGGLGTYEGYAGIRLFTTEDIIFSNDALIMN